MSFEPKSKTINEINFKVVPFAALEALRLKAYLLKTAGPAFGQLLGSFENLSAGLGNMKIDGEKLSGAIETLMGHLGEEEFVALVQRMLKGVSCVIKDVAGKDLFINFVDEFSVKMDLVFQGKLMSIYPVMLFVLEVNFPDFFGKVGGIGNRIQTALSTKGDESDKTFPTA